MTEAVVAAAAPVAERARTLAAVSEEIVVLDYGGQYSQLIARRVRDCGVFSELLPHGVSTDELAARGPRGIILSGGPASVYAEGAPRLDRRLLELGIPVLGICYGMQFHPEVVHTPYGPEILRRFLTEVCGCERTWCAASIVQEQTRRIRAQVGDGRVICGLSGGVDSSVAALLVHRAVGDQLTCVFVDHGLMRKNEGDQVVAAFRDTFHVPLVAVDAEDRFLRRLEGVTDPESKRKIIGEEFIRVFEEQAGQLGNPRFLVQGTLYSDVIESGGGHGAATIKSHHNVGGLPEDP